MEKFISHDDWTVRRDNGKALEMKNDGFNNSKFMLRNTVYGLHNRKMILAGVVAGKIGSACARVSTITYPIIR